MHIWGFAGSIPASKRTHHVLGHRGIHVDRRGGANLPGQIMPMPGPGCTVALAM
ncbi:hypothetical protein I550_0480 [Mycobacterium intracellulare 1956]|uniref:Uncharacterized protein n=1 Tax=Mycobacterium intracellulare 1956 TaxID=1299331 RepID=X8CQ28_MYCIT|nr:hypothetical protein I548_3466 [Mycobacterium intracellulare]EUA57355.1 hypothetical protein I550_0480 [Mycobacterium intracellulare 1956]